MRTNKLLLGLFLVALGYAAFASAQSLADVARAEQARRKAVKSATKVYTNDDLKGSTEEPTPQASAPTGAPAPAAATGAKPEAAKAEAEKAAAKPEEPRKDEKYWRERMMALRNTISRNKILADALQSRINALNADFASRDNPIQRAGIEQDRRSALAEMDRVKQDTEKTNKAITALEDEARKANVPPGWLR